MIGSLYDIACWQVRGDLLDVADRLLDACIALTPRLIDASTSSMLLVAADRPLDGKLPAVLSALLRLRR